MMRMSVVVRSGWGTPLWWRGGKAVVVSVIGIILEDRRVRLCVVLINPRGSIKQKTDRDNMKY